MLFEKYKNQKISMGFLSPVGFEKDYQDLYYRINS